MKYLISILLLIMIVASCDSVGPDESGSATEARLVILNEAYLAEKSIGDSVDIKLGLELSSMPETYWIDFIIEFDGDAFTPEGYTCDIPQSFFYLNGEPFQDDNGNGDWDVGEWFDDEEYDPMEEDYGGLNISY